MLSRWLWPGTLSIPRAREAAEAWVPSIASQSWQIWLNQIILYWTKIKYRMEYPQQTIIPCRLSNKKTWFCQDEVKVSMFKSYSSISMKAAAKTTSHTIHTWLQIITLLICSETTIEIRLPSIMLQLQSSSQESNRLLSRHKRRKSKKSQNKMNTKWPNKQISCWKT